MRASVFFLALFVAPLAWSHPGPGIAVDRKGQVFFVHPVRHRIMKVEVVGRVSIFAQGEEGHKLSLPHHLVLDSQDNLYSVGDRDGVIWRIGPDGATSQIYPPTDGQGIGFFGRGGDPFILDQQGKIYGIHSRLDAFTQILEIGVDGRISLLAGGDYGTVYVLDYLGDDPSVRKISPDGVVTTIANTSKTP